MKPDQVALVCLLVAGPVLSLQPLQDFPERDVVSGVLDVVVEVCVLELD